MGCFLKTKTFFNRFSYIQVTAKKKSRIKVQVAITRKILVAVWYVLSQGIQYIKPTDHSTEADITAVE
ncbi:MAG: hypothetical protein SOX26_05430 [Phocaeicola sp.]|nr:hypothetical protein [Phocaeicola sp.]